MERTRNALALTARCRQACNTEAPGFKDNKAVEQCLLLLLHQPHKIAWKPAPGRSRKTHEDNPTGAMSMREYELTKIFIFRNQDAVFADREIDHVGVFQSLCKFAHCQHVMPIVFSARTTPKSQLSSARNFNDKAASGLGKDAYLLVCERIGRVAHRRLDVLAR